MCESNEFLVKTGLGVDDIQASKTTFRWPFQKVRFISLNPNDYNFNLNNMSKELVPFKLPMVFTIGPVDPQVDMDGFLRYARKMSGLTSEEVTEIINGVVHGETRILSAQLTVQEMFSDRERFKSQIHDKVDKLLKEFGLYVANCNIAEMKDLDADNKYFENMKQKALEQASNQAKIDIAEERKKGNVGERDRLAETEIRMKEIDSNVTQQKNKHEREIAESDKDLALVKYDYSQQQELKRVEVHNIPLQRDQELRADLHKKAAIAKLEELRATELVASKVSAEQEIAIADGQAQSIERLATANLFKSKTEAEAILVKYKCQAEGLSNFIKEIGDTEMVKFFLAIDRNIFVDLANSTATAIQGLQPKLNIWNTGEASSNSPVNVLRDLFHALPPMMEAVQSQTNLKFPSWLPHPNPEQVKN